MKTWCTAISTKSPLRGPVSSRTNPLQKGECMRACLRVWVCAREGACVSARAWLVDVPATPACALAVVAAARHARRAQASMCPRMGESACFGRAGRHRRRRYCAHLSPSSRGKRACPSRAETLAVPDVPARFHHVPKL